MQSENENEDQLLLSNHEDSPERPVHHESPPRNEENRPRRIRRMNREERHFRERARDRRRHHRHERSPRRHHADAAHRDDSNNRNRRYIEREHGQRQQNIQDVLQRSK